MKDTKRYDEHGKLRICYRKWVSMRQRCDNPKATSYPWYGANGIQVCERWQDYENFLSDMGEPPKGYWIDRIDNSLGYQPGNCRWVTPKQSCANRSKTGKAINPDSLRQKCIRAGMPYIRVYQRMMMGWPEAVAMSTPVSRPGGMTHHYKRQIGLMV